MTDTAPPNIEVYASLPRNVVPGTDLDMDPNNWHWLSCLTFSLETLNTLQFSQKPYKWIRYAIGVVIGAQGTLSKSSYLANPVDYNAGLPNDSVVLYYHTSDEERQRMFPTDPSMECAHVTSATATSRRAQFTADVEERDVRCVWTGMEALACDSVHLLAHSKGDRYISTYTQRRSQDPTGADIIHEIDNIQNGLLLNSIAHNYLGSDVAFLMTPNFAMDTSDIDSTAPPHAIRYTGHVFRQPLPAAPLPSNSPLRISNSPDWPPAILFDAVYAGAIVFHFGTQVLKDAVGTTWKNTFYGPGQAMTSSQVNYQGILDRRAAIAGKVQSQARARTTRYEAHHHDPDAFDILLALPYVLVPSQQFESALREVEKKKKKKKAEERHLQEKVETWMEQSN